MKTFKVCTIFGEFHREAETAEQARREFWEWYWDDGEGEATEMTEVRADELFVISGWKELTALRELLLDIEKWEWPVCLEGELILARTRSGKWHARGTLGGLAEWNTKERWWRIRIACPACGSEWWDDEPAPRNPCCQNADFEVGEG